MKVHTTGERNIAIGVLALENATTSERNTAIGFEAMHDKTTGNYNTVVGYQSGYAITTGEANCCIGYKAGASNITDGDQHLYIARDDAGRGNDACWIHCDQVGDATQGSNATHWAQTSDQRLKKDIVDNNVGLSAINKIKVRNFKFKQYIDGSPVTSDDTVDMNEFPKASNVNQVLLRQGHTELQLGIIAQEMETALPNAVKIDDRGVKTLNVDPVIWALVNAVKELSTEVNALKAT